MLEHEVIKSKYDCDGFCSIESILSSEEILNLRSYIDYYIKNFAKLLSGRDINWLDIERNLVNSIHKTDLDPTSPITEMLNSKKMLDLVGGLLGETPTPRCAEIFHKPARVGLKSPMHQDNYYWCLQPANALTVWLSLTGADESNGGVEYYVGSHKLGLLEHVDSFAPGSSQMVKPALLPETRNKVIPSLCPGDALFHHSLTIHGSAANKSDRDRIGLTLQYEAESCSIDIEQQQIYLNGLANQLLEREKLAEEH